MLRELGYYLYLKSNMSPNTNPIMLDTLNKYSSMIARSDLKDVIRRGYNHIEAFTRYYVQNADKIKEYVPPLHYYIPLMYYINKKDYKGPYHIHTYKECNGNLLISPYKTIDIHITKYRTKGFFESMLFNDKLTFDKVSNLIASQCLPVIDMYKPNNLQEFFAYADILEEALIPDYTKRNVKAFVKDILVDTNSNNQLVTLESMSTTFKYVGKALGLHSSLIDYILSGIGTVSDKDDYSASFLGKHNGTIHRTVVTMEDDETGDEDLPDEEGDEELEDEETDDDTTTDDETSETDEDRDEDTDDDSDESEDDVDNSGEMEESAKEEELHLLEHLKTVDGYKFKVDLINNDTLSNLIWKYHVCNTIAAYKEDPPKHLALDTLVILDIWCNKWIFLVTVDTSKELFKQLNLNM